MKISTLKGFVCLVASLVVFLGGIRTASAQANNTIFGPNVYVFSPGSDTATQTTLNTSAVGGIGQFGTGRVAVFFKPGTYNLQAKIGFNEAVYGLGMNPGNVVINGYITPNFSGSVSTNMTTIFWRSMANMTFNPGHNTSQNNPPNTLQWGVSQGTSLRRIQINGNLQMDGSELGTTGICGWASGGFVADIVVTGYMDPCAQQQWFTRNSNLGSWDDVLNVWNQGHIDNMVFSGVNGAPAQTFALADPRTVPDNTVVEATPRSREMPFLYMDSGGNYNVFVPTLQTNSVGATWTGGGLGIGYSLPIGTFFIATPTSTLAAINAALASGQNLVLTPGIYKYSGSIIVNNPNTIVLGMGYPALQPQTGTPAISVADVDGVSVSGLLIDATSVNSPVQLQIGVAGGPRVRHISNPTWLSDIFMRVGGAVAGTAVTSLEVDSDDVILDNMWLWRADHGTGAGWTNNVSAHGLVVNGDYVLATGLAVEHYEANQVLWNGNGGETIFFQDEPPYDVPNQAAWMNGSANGFAPYAVSAGVTTHQAYGLGVYCNFTSGKLVVLDSAVTVPVAPGVTVTDALSYNLSAFSPGGGVRHVVNNAGAGVGPGTNTTAYMPFYGITPLIVRANNATRTAGSANPAFSASYSGFINGDTAAVLAGLPAFSTTATNISAPGIYPIKVTKGTLSAANNFPYAFNFADGTLSVVSAPPSVILTTSAIVTGSAAGGYTATVTVTNSGTGPAPSVTLTTGTLGGVAALSGIPSSLGTIAPGGSAAATVTFSGAGTTDGQHSSESFAGTYGCSVVTTKNPHVKPNGISCGSSGTFSGGLRVTLP